MTPQAPPARVSVKVVGEREVVVAGQPPPVPDLGRDEAAVAPEEPRTAAAVSALGPPVLAAIDARRRGWAVQPAARSEEPPLTPLPVAGRASERAGGPKSSFALCVPGGADADRRV